MPPAPSTTSYALLGLLSIRPWTTYELAQQVERSLGWFWPRTPRKVYDDAKRLVDAGHATGTTRATGRRTSTVYEITDAGRAALAGWLGTPSAPAKLESEAMVRVFFADAGSRSQLQHTLRSVEDEARARLEVLATMAASVAADDYAFASRRHVNVLAMRFQIDQHRAAATWARWAQEQVAAWTSTGDPGDWDWETALGISDPDGSG